MATGAEALSSGQDTADEQGAVATAEGQQGAEAGLPDWWTLADTQKKLRSDPPPPRPDQAAGRREAGATTQAWKRLSRVRLTAIITSLEYQ